MGVIRERLSLEKRKLLSAIAPTYETKRIYRYNFGRECNLENPVTINEKLQYLKLHDYYKNDTVTMCVDKYRLREYLAGKKLEHLCPKLYGVYDSTAEIDWDVLPDSFVIKCNHGCGYNILCPDKSRLDIKESVRLLKQWMKEDYWKEFAEVQYRYVKKKIIAEEYLGDELRTYKFYCFNGVPKVLYVSENGENGEKDKYLNYYSMDWEMLPYCLSGHVRKTLPHPKPEHMDELVRYAEILSRDFPFVRVDLYDVNGKVYISELTFIPTGGFMHLIPEGTDIEWGNWLDLKQKKDLARQRERE